MSFNNIFKRKNGSNDKVEAVRIPYNHYCPECQTSYIPYENDIHCPGCGILEEERFNFIPLAAQTLIFNYVRYGSFLPKNDWKPESLAEHVYVTVAQVFDGFRADIMKGNDKRDKKSIEKYFTKPEEFSLFTNRAVSSNLKWSDASNYYDSYISRLIVKIYMDINSKLRSGWIERFYENQSNAGKDLI